MMKGMRILCAMLLLCALGAQAQAAVDTDRDGLPDVLEQALLERFAPTFMISKDDCSVAPASLMSGRSVPTVGADDGTIYGQVFKTDRGVELHYYHLWRADCGRLGHALDDEHVSALVVARSAELASDAASYSATYWYAAAHEDTVCDASQVTRASTLDASTHGPVVWVSAGKHASFLAEELCRHGCGGDRCAAMKKLDSPGVVNVGEVGAPMSGAEWTTSPLWPGPLAIKMSRSDLPEDRVARLNALPNSDIAWANPGQRPAQAVILGGNSTIDALALGNRKTDTALVTAGGHTGGALGNSYKATRNALGKSFHKTGEFLSGGRKNSDAQGGAQIPNTCSANDEKIQ